MSVSPRCPSGLRPAWPCLCPEVPQAESTLTMLLPRVTKCHRTAPDDASPSPRAPRSGRGRQCCLGARGQQRMLCEQPGSSSSSIPGMKLKLIPGAAWAQSLASSSSLHFVLRAGAGGGRVGGRAPLTGAVRVLVPWQHPHSVPELAPGGFGAPSPGTIPRRGMRSRRCIPSPSQPTPAPGRPLFPPRLPPPAEPGGPFPMRLGSLLAGGPGVQPARCHRCVTDHNVQ